ncbi:MAG: type VI secretion system tube protein Hcp [Alphaproteobacteria bacterium]|nr:type VI secretion system tube protein Hcp [Alphaproteobacteria bacterium]
MHGNKRGEIEILSWSFGVSQGVGLTGPTTFDVDVVATSASTTFEVELDGALAPGLGRAIVAAVINDYAGATFVYRESFDDGESYVEYKLQKVLVSSFSVSGASGSSTVEIFGIFTDDDGASQLRTLGTFEWSNWGRLQSELVRILDSNVEQSDDLPVGIGPHTSGNRLGFEGTVEQAALFFDESFANGEITQETFQKLLDLIEPLSGDINADGTAEQDQGHVNVNVSIIQFDPPGDIIASPIVGTSQTNFTFTYDEGTDPATPDELIQAYLEVGIDYDVATRSEPAAAAISIPADQDYTLRTKISSGLALNENVFPDGSIDILII